MYYAVNEIMQKQQLEEAENGKHISSFLPKRDERPKHKNEGRQEPRGPGTVSLHAGVGASLALTPSRHLLPRFLLQAVCFLVFLHSFLHFLFLQLIPTSHSNRTPR